MTYSRNRYAGHRVCMILKVAQCYISEFAGAGAAGVEV